jgi:NADH dehydrogenase
MQRRVVTVFGGSGFLGRHLVKRLAARDAIVRVAVRDPEAALFLKPLGDVGQIVPWAADVTDKESVAFAVNGADSVVNLVGILFEKGKRTFERIHAEGAANVAAAAAAAGVKRLVQVSAIGADPESASAYARTKAAGEAAVMKAFPDATIVRPSVVFGPEDGFFNLFAGVARISPMLPVFGCPIWPKITFGGEGFPFKVDLYGDGGTKFQPVYVGDVADAIVVILTDPKTKGKTYELGGPRVYSFKAIMELLLKEIGRRRLIVPIPFAVGMIQGFFLQMLPRPLLTCDQVTLLKRDNVVAPGALTFKDLGISPTTAETILPTYLKRFRRPSKAATLSPT